MRPAIVFTALIGCLLGCDVPPGPSGGGIAKAKKSAGSTTSGGLVTLTEARAAFATTLARRESAGMPAPSPPAHLAQLVYYDAPLGKNAAYLTHPSSPGQKHPAIVWISGGDCNTIDDGFFQPASADNDQTAAAFRNAGVITLYVSLRGGNNNPGVREGFYGEVDDVIAAAAFLRQQESVDPNRIYLGGHSTGGTLALLVAESTDQFRAIFSFGPVDDPAGYGGEYTPYVATNPQEGDLRSPVKWVHSIKSPTYVIEGGNWIGGNVTALRAIKSAGSQNARLRCLEVRGADHFSVLAPVTAIIAQKIVQDTGPSCSIQLQDSELSRSFGN
jgi:alpha/beta superfamily hydrolase